MSNEQYHSSLSDDEILQLASRLPRVSVDEAWYVAHSDVLKQALMNEGLVTIATYYPMPNQIGYVIWDISNVPRIVPHEVHTLVKRALALYEEEHMIRGILELPRVALREKWTRVPNSLAGPQQTRGQIITYDEPHDDHVRYWVWCSQAEARWVPSEYEKTAEKIYEWQVKQPGGSWFESAGFKEMKMNLLELSSDISDGTLRNQIAPALGHKAVMLGWYVTSYDKMRIAQPRSKGPFTVATVSATASTTISYIIWCEDGLAREVPLEYRPLAARILKAQGIYVPKSETIEQHSATCPSFTFQYGAEGSFRVGYRPTAFVSEWQAHGAILYFEISDGPDKGSYIAASKFFDGALKTETVIRIEDMPTELLAP
jgi:hypothetical protein